MEGPEKEPEKEPGKASEKEFIYSITLDREGGLHPSDIPARTLGMLICALSDLFTDNPEEFRLIGISDNCVKMDFACAGAGVMSAIESFVSGLASKPLAPLSATFLWKLHRLEHVRRWLLHGISMLFAPIGKTTGNKLPPDARLLNKFSTGLENYDRDTLYGKVAEVNLTTQTITLVPFGSQRRLVCTCRDNRILQEARSWQGKGLGFEGCSTRDKNYHITWMDIDVLLPYRENFDSNFFDRLRENGMPELEEPYRSMPVEDLLKLIRGYDDEEEVFVAEDQQKQENAL